MIEKRYPAPVHDPPTTDDTVERWAASGAMALTGLPDQPLGPPDGLVDGVERLGARFAGLDTLALLGERAALMGLWRRGAVSCGGSCHLLPSSAGWVAVSLPREEDMESVPAWLELDHLPPTAPATWRAVEGALARRGATELLARARLLALPVAAVGEVAAGLPGVRWSRLGDAPARPLAGLRVTDLSALWAGPLCGDLLARAGADVVKVESWARPDGARRGPAAFFDLLNGGQRSLALDLGNAEGRGVLRRLLRRSDVVIEASRPRALAQMGIDAAELVATGGPQVWISITGYGRGRGPDPEGRVAFGDDAAAAGGLVVWPDDGSPLFCADAVADPLTGLAAAGACLDALARGGRWLLDLPMAGVCAALTGPTLPVPSGVVVADPRARQPAGRAPALGADTGAVLADLAASEHAR
jgi:CoA-transferase family III